MAKKIKLDRNTQNWIEDRIENNEPLAYMSFLEMAKDMEEDKARYHSKAYQKRVKALYKKRKKEYKKGYRSPLDYSRRFTYLKR